MTIEHVTLTVDGLRVECFRDDHATASASVLGIFHGDRDGDNIAPMQIRAFYFSELLRAAAEAHRKMKESGR